MTTTEKERWLPVANYEGYYEVSNLGNVRSVTRVIRAWNGVSLAQKTYAGRLRTAVANKDGYRIVTLSRDNRVRHLRVGRLVLEAFVGPCPCGHECAHNDGNPHNDELTNLRWATPKENTADQIRHGTFRRAKGERQGYSKLTEQQIHEIKALRANRVSIARIAETYQISESHVSRIALGKTWSYIT